MLLADAFVASQQSRLAIRAAETAVRFAEMSGNRELTGTAQAQLERLRATSLLRNAAR